MKPLSGLHLGRWLGGLVALATVALMACGGAATATPRPEATATSVATAAPAATATRAAPTPTTQRGATPLPAATATPFPTPVATVVPPTPVVTAKDTITVVTAEEPLGLDSTGASGGIMNFAHYDSMADPLTWQSGDDLRIVPTTASVGWEQLAADKWRFQLRRGVKFHNGEPWNAQAALPSIDIIGKSTAQSVSFQYTGSYTAQAADEYVLDIICGTACPVFPNTAMFLNFTAPKFLTTATEEEKARQNNSFGPYKQVKWTSGVSLTMTRYEDYVPAGDHYEMQKGLIREINWVWRGEPQVMVAMVQAGEADISWDVGVEALKVLKPENTKSGGSAEIWGLAIDSMYNKETRKQKVRLAMEHAINCQEIIDSLYGGNSICRGNIIWPGVIGATEENTAPYKYDPDLARRLLKEANYDFNTVIRMWSRGTRIPKNVEVLEALASYLEDVGMKVDLRVLERQEWLDTRNCRAGTSVKELLKTRGRGDVDPNLATLEEMQAAMAVAAEKGSPCPTAELIDDAPSNETLDFGRQVLSWMSCGRIRSNFCDPSPGGAESKIKPALAASGAERQRLLQELADIFHEQALWIGLFDLPVIYAVNPKLVWEPRFERRVRVNSMRFSQ